MGGHHHHHDARASADATRLGVAAALIAGFLAVEVVAGVLASSLALLSDAAHMLTDVGALVLALVAARLATRPAGGAMTYGLGRAEIMSAHINGASLAVLALVIVYEAIRRLVSPPDVDGAVVLGVALAGVAVNLAATRVLAGGERRSLNVEGAFQHLVTDLAAFGAAAAAGAVVLVTGFERADPIASLLVAGLMLHASWRLLKASGRVFLEAAPEGVDPERIGRAMAAEPGVVQVHDLHVWEVTSGFPALSAHIVVEADSDCHATRRRLARMLRSEFGLRHTTLQVEHAAPPQLVSIEGTDG
jgi:cobalt-zinc-cadmium efflux system protein